MTIRIVAIGVQVWRCVKVGESLAREVSSGAPSGSSARLLRARRWPLCPIFILGKFVGHGRQGDDCSFASILVEIPSHMDTNGLSVAETIFKGSRIVRELCFKDR